MSQPNSGWVRRARSVWMLSGLVAMIAAGGDGLAVQPDAPRNATDTNGDPLPAGALARLGTLRWRHGQAVTFVAFLPDGKEVLTGSQERVLRLWDRATGKEIRRFPLPAIEPMANGPGRVVRVPFMASQLAVLAALSNDGKTAAAAVNNIVQLWDVDTGKAIRQIKGPPTGILEVRFAPDDQSLAVRSGDQAIHLFATDTGNEIRALNQKQPKQAQVVINRRIGLESSSLAFSPDGHAIAAIESEAEQQGVKNFVRISAVEAGREIRRIDLPNSASAIAYAPSGKLLAVAVGGDVYLYDPADGTEIRKLAASAGAASLLFTPNSKTLVGRGRNKSVCIWDVETGKLRHMLGEANPLPRGVDLALVRFPGGDAHNVAVSADGKTVATGSNNMVRMWEIDSGKEVPLAGGHRGSVIGVAISRDGKRAVSRGSDNVIRTWDLVEGRAISQFPEPPGTLTMAFAPDGRTLAFGCGDGKTRLVDAGTGKLLAQFLGPNPQLIVFAPDGKTLASITGAGNSQIVIQDAVKGEVRRKIALPAPMPADGNVVVVRGNAPSGGGASFAFSPDSKTLYGQFPANDGGPFINAGGAIGGGPAAAATTLHVWDVATGKELRKIVLPERLCTGSIALSPDGRVLACENADGTVSLWELASGKERGRFGKVDIAKAPAPQMTGTFFAVALRGGGGVQARTSASTVAFSPDGRLVAFKGPAQSVRVWDVDAATEIGAFAGHDGAITTLAFAPDNRRLVTGSTDTTILVWDLPSMRRPATPPAVELNANDLATLWDDLLGDDARKAFESIRRVAASPRQAVPHLRELVKPVVPADPSKVDRLIKQLDSDDFEDRNTATEELARLGDLAVPALQQLASGQPTLEARRRVDALLLRLTTGALTPEQVRVVRVVEALERAGTPDARQLLQALASGAPGALTTRQAQAALDRMR
jgi:WD40 repeat protein